MSSKKGLKLKRAWLILRLKSTNKIVILKRSKTSNNAKQWDFIGGSSKKRGINPRKLIRKESYEEIGFNPPFLVLRDIIINKFSIYYYYSSTISYKELESLELSHEHSRLKFISLIKLKKRKNLHHSIKTYLKL